MTIYRHVIIKIINEWKQSPVVYRFVSNSFWMVCARCFWVLNALTVGVFVARKLGPHEYGVVNYAVAYVGLFSVIAGLGVDRIIQRDFILHPENRNRLAGNYFLFKIVMTVLMLAVCGFSLFFNSNPQLVTACLIVSTGYIFYPLNTVCLILNVLVKNEYNAFAQLITCFVYNGLRLAAVLYTATVEIYLIAEALLTGLPAILFFLFYCWKVGNPLRWTYSVRETFRLLIPALPLSFSAVFGTVYARTDMLMLEHYIGISSIGYYTIAARFTENWILFTGLFSSIFSVAVINGFKTSPEEYKKQLHRYYFMLFFISIPPVILNFLSGDFVIHFLYGSAYAPAIPVFYVYMLSIVFTTLLGGFFCHAMNENRLYTIAAVSGAGALLNIPLNMFLIPCFGMCGAAFSTVVSMPLGFLVVILLTAKGRADLRFIFFSLIHLPSFWLNKEKQL